jgi:hypothetical protein
MIVATPPVYNYVQSGTAAVIYREGALNSSFWMEHIDLFPAPSASVFWTRERHFIQLSEGTRITKAFKTGWDGYDAPAPSDAAVAVTLKVLSQLQSSSSLNPYSVLPSADGGVGISFRGRHEKRAVLEMLNDGTSSYMLYGKGQPTESSEFSLDRDFPRILRRLMEYL